jgi:hypothetical protein
VKGTTHTKVRRLVKALALGLAAAAISTPVAQAGHQDGLVLRERDAQVAVHPDGYQPQLRGGQTSAIVDGWQTRFAPETEIVDGWAGRFEAPEPVALVGYRVPDGYQPDVGVREPSAAPVEITGRFDWSDAGIGAGMAFGTMLLAAAAALAMRTRGRVAHS